LEKSRSAPGKAIGQRFQLLEINSQDRFAILCAGGGDKQIEMGKSGFQKKEILQKQNGRGSKEVSDSNAAQRRCFKPFLAWFMRHIGFLLNQHPGA
jgi:hypothetical protein